MASMKRSHRSMKERMSAVGKAPVQKAVIKATDSEHFPPKKKHVERLLGFSHREETPIQDIADTLIQRLDGSTWLVVLKGLVVCHHLMRDGHERFMRFLCTRSSLFGLDGYIDRKTPEGLTMSAFIRKYAKYLTDKVLVCRSLGYDCTHVFGGDKAVAIKTMDVPQLFSTMQEFERLIGSALNSVSLDNDVVDHLNQGHGEVAVKVEVNQEQVLANPVIRAALSILLKDILKLFVIQNDGVVNLLERYFTMSKQNAVEAFGIYETFVAQCHGISDFMFRCKDMGIFQGRNTPDLTQAPSMLLPAMKEYIDDYGTRKGTRPTTLGTEEAVGNRAALGVHASQFESEQDAFAAESEIAPFNPFSASHAVSSPPTGGMSFVNPFNDSASEA